MKIPTKKNNSSQWVCGVTDMKSKGTYFVAVQIVLAKLLLRFY